MILILPAHSLSFFASKLSTSRLCHTKKLSQWNNPSHSSTGYRVAGQHGENCLLVVIISSTSWLIGHSIIEKSSTHTYYVWLEDPPIILGMVWRLNNERRVFTNICPPTHTGHHLHPPLNNIQTWQWWSIINMVLWCSYCHLAKHINSFRHETREMNKFPET